MLEADFLPYVFKHFKTDCSIYYPHMTVLSKYDIPGFRTANSNSDIECITLLCKAA